MRAEEKIRKLIRLKRYETPPEGYFEDFLVEFQNRRNRQLAAVGSVSLMDRLACLFQKKKASTWVLGAGLAYAALVLALVWLPESPDAASDENRQPVIYEPVPDQNQEPAPVKPQPRQSEF